MQLERSLRDIGELTKRIEAASRKVGVTAKAVGRTAETGELVALRAQRAKLAEAAAELERLVGELVGGLAWDEAEEEQHLRDGGFVQELRESARSAGIELHAFGPGWSAHPVIIRIDPKSRSVRLDRKRLKKLRPSLLISEIAKARSAKPRLSPDQFLDVISAGYDLVLAKKQQEATGDDGIVRLVDVYEALTLLPETRREYPVEEFGRDLHQLATAGVGTDRAGRELYLSAATSTKTNDGVITVVDADGRPHLYFAMALRAVPS